MVNCRTCDNEIKSVSYKLVGRDDEDYVEFCSDLCKSRFPFKYKRTGIKNRPLQVIK